MFFWHTLYRGEIIAKKQSEQIFEIVVRQKPIKETKC